LKMFDVPLSQQCEAEHVLVCSGFSLAVTDSETQILETTSCMKPWGWRRRKRVEESETEDQQVGVGHTAAQTDPNCKLEDKAEDGEVLDCKKRLDEGEELEEEAVHSCDSCLQVFESLSDITEHKINQCQLT
ncbi:PREDICTED: zinc finger protein 423-like, partial [Pterocles gutturalis]|uniref:zinc finger protein 423-like n=1 Tax=Pterocles gutturalis TaxID=240206 RepID=UPI000528E647